MSLPPVGTAQGLPHPFVSSPGTPSRQRTPRRLLLLELCFLAASIGPYGPPNAHGGAATVTQATISLAVDGETETTGGLYGQGAGYGPEYYESTNYGCEGALACTDADLSGGLSEDASTNWVYSAASVNTTSKAGITTGQSPGGIVTISASLTLQAGATGSSMAEYWGGSASGDSSASLNVNVDVSGAQPVPYRLQYSFSAHRNSPHGLLDNNWYSRASAGSVANWEEKTLQVDCSSSVATNDGASGAVEGELPPGPHELNIGGSVGVAYSACPLPPASAGVACSVTLTLGPPTAELIFHALRAGGLVFATSDGVDDPLVPVTDPATLSSQPVISGGLVADGVTPLLGEINFGAPLPTPYTYTIALAPPVGGTAPIQLATLSAAGWQDGNSVSVPAGMSNAFFYIKPLKCEDVQLNGSPDVGVGLSLQDDIPGYVAATNTLHLRKPPIALVHGYATDQNTWSPEFIKALEATRPADFIIPVAYGTANGDEDNTSGKLDHLARVLDEQLRQQVESPLSKDWAFTRYDVVAHSQGGVLVRMLCQNVPPPFRPFAQSPVVSADNFYRGRFRRVITIGAPQNGSLIARYGLALKSSASDVVQWLLGAAGKYIQKKFDPFGRQIAEINNPAFPVDPRTKFLCLATTIDGGKPPDQSTTNWWYALLGLRFPGPGNQLTRGQVLLPEGSDGVVAPPSAFGGAGTRSALLGDRDIAHFEKIAPGPDMSQTTSPEVAANILTFLDGPSSAFGSFVLPSPLPPTLAQTIDTLAASVTSGGIVAPYPHPLSGQSFSFGLAPSAPAPADGTVNWLVLLYGTNGVSMDPSAPGVELTTSTNPISATVTVDDSVIGQVLLEASYTLTTGTLVFSTPTLVVSHLPGSLTGIELRPAAIDLSPGDAVSTELWGTYDNGQSMPLFLTNGAASFSSSDPTVATVDSSGTVAIQSFGDASITASYAGFSAQAAISTGPPFVGAIEPLTPTNGQTRFVFSSSVGSTDTIEASTNLVDWAPIATLQSTNGLVPFQDDTSQQFPMRFYRVEAH